MSLPINPGMKELAILGIEEVMDYACDKFCVWNGYIQASSWDVGMEDDLEVLGLYLSPIDYTNIRQVLKHYSPCNFAVGDYPFAMEDDYLIGDCIYKRKIFHHETLEPMLVPVYSDIMFIDGDLVTANPRYLVKEHEILAELHYKKQQKNEEEVKERHKKFYAKYNDDYTLK